MLFLLFCMNGFCSAGEGGQPSASQPKHETVYWSAPDLPTVFRFKEVVPLELLRELAKQFKTLTWTAEQRLLPQQDCLEHI